MTLTAKQEAFAQEWFATGNKSEVAQLFVDAYMDGQGFHKACSSLFITPSEQSGQKHYVYALVRTDTDSIVYIGKGKDDRMFCHMKEVEKGRVSGARKYKGLKDLNEIGVKVRPFCIFDGMTDAEAHRVEKTLIGGCRSDALLNSMNGSRGYNESQTIKCQNIIDNMTSLVSMAGSRKGYRYDLARVIIRKMEILLAEFSIAEKTGFKYDGKRQDRIDARSSYLAGHPEAVPKPDVEWPDYEATD